MSRPGSEGGPSIVMYRLGGRDHPLRTAPCCKVCNSESRFDVERALASGQAYAAIVRSLPDGHGLSAANVASHYRAGHLPLDVAAVRAILEDRARQLGQDIEEGVQDLVDHVGLARVVVRQVFNGLAEGTLHPDVSDGLAAARLLQGLDAEVGSVDQAAWVEAFMIYHDTARRLMSPSQFEQFGQELSGNPLLQALRARHSAREDARSL